jgi:hypothetical protein
MIDKGYPHPLFSLDLINHGDSFADNGRYSIPVNQGFLVISKPLRVRAQNRTADATTVSLFHALSYHALDVAGFAAYGLDKEWADNMQYWNQRLHEKDSDRGQLVTTQQLATIDRKARFADARRLWARLSLAARMAGRPGTLTSGAAPQGMVALLDALQKVQPRAKEQAALLALHGFGPEQQADLAAAIAALQKQHEEASANGDSRRQMSDRLIVIRGAILGDLCRLSQAAPHVMGKWYRAPLLMQNILSRRRSATAGT